MQGLKATYRAASGITHHTPTSNLLSRTAHISQIAVGVVYQYVSRDICPGNEIQKQ